MSDTLSSTYTTDGSLDMADSIFEDVEGVVQNITPHKTPFIASIGKTKVQSTYHEWLEDTLKSATSNAAVEGADATATEVDPPSRLGNYTQIFQDSFLLSGTLEAVNKIGRKSEAKYQLEKSLKYVNTCIEYACLNNTSSNAGASDTARNLNGLGGFISTNDESYSTYGATNDFDESKLMTMSQAIFDYCDEDEHILLVPSDQARKISAWDQNSRITVNTNADEKKIIMAVMVLETPFGRIRIVIDRYIAQATDSGSKYDTVFLYEPGKCKLGWLRNIKTNELSKTGDSKKFQTIGECTLIVHSEKSAAKCSKCATD